MQADAVQGGGGQETSRWGHSARGEGSGLGRAAGGEDQ